MRPFLTALLTLLAGVAGGLVLAMFFMADSRAEVEVVEGTVTAVRDDGAAIGLAGEGTAPGAGYVIAGAPWREGTLPWSDRSPSCLKPGVSGQRVRLGVVHARASGDAPGRTVVVWLECLPGGGAPAGTPT